MPDNPLQEFRCYSAISESWELMRTGMVMIAGEMYKLELWQSYSNPDASFFVAIYVQQDGVWHRMKDSPFPLAPDADEAMRRAMAFLAEREAA